LQLARIPEADFEAAVEAENPPVVEKLAERGKLKPERDYLEGRDPADFQAATWAMGAVRRFRELLDEMDTDAIVRGSLPKERPDDPRDQVCDQPPKPSIGAGFLAGR
jgi:hypothetical protein